MRASSGILAIRSIHYPRERERAREIKRRRWNKSALKGVNKREGCATEREFEEKGEEGNEIDKK